MGDETTMTEWVWVMLTIWFMLLLYSHIKKDDNIQTIDAVMGVIFGILYLRTSDLLGLLFIAVNIYLLYDSIGE